MEATEGRERAEVEAEPFGEMMRRLHPNCPDVAYASRRSARRLRLLKYFASRRARIERTET